jgi:flagellar biosynthesis protein
LPSETAPSDAGRQAVAARILELAQAHGMNLRPSGDLRELLAGLQIGDPIPIPAFAVVAEILFAILQANQNRQADWETMP